MDLEVKSKRINLVWSTTSDVFYLATGNMKWRNGMRSHVWRPATDVYETEDTVVVRVEIAGMREEDFEISLMGQVLTIRGSRPDIQERRAYHQMEIFFGDFSTEVELPTPILSEQVSAEYQQGFLRLVFMKDIPKRIPVSD